MAEWGLNALGDWSDYQVNNNPNDEDPDDYTDAGDLDQDRTHNDVNEITGISEGGGQTAWLDPAYDAVGNMTSGPVPTAPTTRQHFKYDAWNRLAAVYADDGGEELFVSSLAGVCKMRFSQLIRWFGLLVTCALCLTACQCNSRKHKASSGFPLHDYIDVVIESVKARNGAAGLAHRERVEIMASLVNKTPDEIEIDFDSRVYKTAGGFFVQIGSQIYTPHIRLVGRKQDNLPAHFGLLPAHGRKTFELLVWLPEAEAQRVLAKREGLLEVVLIVHMISHKGTDTDIHPGARVLGRW